jgi:hypothetical protein
VKDYYAILGVHHNASEAEIKRAFRRLAVKYHPDKNPDHLAEQLFKEINEAYSVLGDPSERRAYDNRLENPFASILTEDPQPRHRDPAYKRKPPANQRPPRESETLVLMKEYIGYVQWASRIGLVLSVIFFIDYVIPHSIVEEEVSGVSHVRGRRGFSHYKVNTASGKQIKIYPEDMDGVFNEKTIVVAYTFFYKTPMSVSTLQNKMIAQVGYIYRSLILFPAALLITSFLGVLFRKKLEFCFNVSIVSGVLLIINAFLI